eukprot:Nitzschia sp. Nitz4//scaffold62_size106224//95250//97075//NITZ4_004371-RA/size106224-snap-gene-0.132-mRNA-1//-1//CDS//3329555901//187//frame0
MTEQEQKEPLRVSTESKNMEPNRQVSPTKRKRNAPIQLQRPANACDKVQSLLTRYDLTSDDITNFLSGEDLPNCPIVQGSDCITNMEQQFYDRRAEIYEMTDQLSSGITRMDDDGRLVVAEPPRPPRAILPPPPGHHQAVQPPPVNRGRPRQGPQQPQEDADDLRDPPPAHDQRQPQREARLTFRRICFAVLAVITAFVCVILHSLPSLQPTEAIDPNFDKLLHELLQVRFLKQHLYYCPDLQRGPGDIPTPWFGWSAFQGWLRERWGVYTESHCHEGVLHLPSQRVLANSLLHATPEEASLLKPYRYGFNATWTIPCQDVDVSSAIGASSCYPGRPSTTDPHLGESSECPAPSKSVDSCFRGVHDNQISSEEIDDALRLGQHLILEGGDHFDVHYDVPLLYDSLPTVLQKLEQLLEKSYSGHLTKAIKPIAFRIQTTGPMDSHEVNMFDAAAVTLNQTRYLDWVKRCKRQNQIAQFSLPWPFRTTPIRDTCNLMADMEADPRFAVQTTVFLTNGAGMGFRGGVTLFVDHHRTNYNPQHRILRGLSIDGSAGRVFVSTGGVENRHCRLPMRAGLRSVLQIWWGCTE